MIKNRDLPAYFFILLVSTFLTCSVDAQEKAENKIYADEHMQFLLPEKFRGESDTEKPFQVCLTDDAGSRIYFAVRKRADKTIAGGITVSDYGSKLWGLQKQKINWIRMQRSEDSNDCLMIYFWQAKGMEYLFLLEGSQIKMDLLAMEVEKNIIF